LSKQFDYDIEAYSKKPAKLCSGCLHGFKPTAERPPAKECATCGPMQENFVAAQAMADQPPLINTEDLL
jgi:rRNA maturation endonuclease Nob1